MPGRGHVGFSPTMQASLAPSARRNVRGWARGARRVSCTLLSRTGGEVDFLADDMWMAASNRLKCFLAWPLRETAVGIQWAIMRTLIEGGWGGLTSAGAGEGARTCARAFQERKVKTTVDAETGVNRGARRTDLHRARTAQPDGNISYPTHAHSIQVFPQISAKKERGRKGKKQT